MDSYHENEPISLHLSDLFLIRKERTDFHNIEIYKHPSLGKILVLDDEIHHVEEWVSMYHESIVHIPMSFIEYPKQILILGGGSLYAAREVLKYPNAEVTMVDHDKTLVEIISENYEHARLILNDPNFTIIYEDAVKYLSDSETKFDLIINDWTSLLNFETHPYSNNIFDLFDKRLKDEGVCVDLIYRHIYDKALTNGTINLLKRRYSLAISLVTVPEYPGIFHILCVWSKSKKVDQLVRESRNKFHLELLKDKVNNEWPFEFFDPKFLGFYLYIPPYITKHLSQ